MPRRKNTHRATAGSSAPAASTITLENITNFQSQIMTRSRRKNLEMIASNKSKDTEPSPAKKGRQHGTGKGPPKSSPRISDEKSDQTESKTKDTTPGSAKKTSQHSNVKCPPKSSPRKKDEKSNRPKAETKGTAPGPSKNSSKSSPRDNDKKRDQAASISDAENSKTSGVVVDTSLNLEDQIVLEQYKSMRRILGAKCADVVDRMKLYYIPYCIRNRARCTTYHAEKCPPPYLIENDLKSKALYLLSEERHPHFIKFVGDMCIRGEFPGTDIINKIWELVLTLTVPEDENYTSSWATDECVCLFETIVSKFPPCWHAIRKSYMQLLMDPINTKNILPNRNASMQTITQFVISTLSETMKEAPDQELDESVNEECFNFHEWEMKNMPKHDFEALSRDEKLDRLFDILHYVTKLLELDLAVWIQRHIANPKKYLLGEERPLISAVFGFDQYTQITNLVKQTLEVYISCVCFRYPPHQTDRITRLVSLLSVAINLSEKSTTKGLKYPNIGSATEEFVKEIFKTIDGLVGRGIEHFLMVIRNTKIPFVKYMLINHFFFKMNADRGEMSAKKILEFFRKQRWLECELADKEVELPTMGVEGLKYPVIPKKISKPYSIEIYRHVYLNLLLTALKAYCEVYAIRDIAQLFAQHKSNESSGSKKNIPRKEVVPTEELDLSDMEDNIDALEAQVDMKQTFTREPDEKTSFEGIHIDADVMKLYRNELKCLLILKKNIPILREKHGSILDEFYDFTQKEIFGDD